MASRRLAVACPSAGVFVEIRLPDPTKKRRPNPRSEVKALMDWMVAHVPPDAHVWVEAPFVGANGNKRTAIRLGMTVGAILATHAGPATLVDQSTWKAQVIGNGHAGKPDVERWLSNHCPEIATACAQSEDLRDAACLALYGELAAERELCGAVSS